MALDFLESLVTGGLLADLLVDADSDCLGVDLGSGVNMSLLFSEIVSNESSKVSSSFSMSSVDLSLVSS